MCLVLFHHDPASTVRLLLAANRDEYYDRPSAPPGVLESAPMIVGGRDERAGGTWLGVNEYGVVAAITNRHTGAPETAGLPSRGLLCLEALRQATAHLGALAAVQLAARASYNPFTLLTFDEHEAWMLDNIDAQEPRPISPGWHVLGNTMLDDGDDPRVRRASELRRLHCSGDVGNDLAAPLAAICADHGEFTEEGVRTSICIHGERAGTRSSSIVVLAERGETAFLHADGPPCKTPYVVVPLPWWRKR